MKDISEVLDKTAKQNDCSVLSALLLLLENELKEDNKHVCELQSKPKQTACRRLRNTSDF